MGAGSETLAQQGTLAQHVGDPRTAAHASSQDFADHPTFLDPGQTLVESLKRGREATIIDSHQVQDRRIQIANVNGVFDDVVAEVVGFAMHAAAANAAARHPHRKALGMMVATVRLCVSLPWQ